MSTSRTQKSAGHHQLQRSESGRPLCRRCSVEVPKGRRSFCGEVCVHEWMLRTNPAYLRQQVFKRDKGVCRACGVDTEQWRRIAHGMRYAERTVFLASIKVPENRMYGAWDADHIVAVVEGGGETGLENIQTLCVPCHRMKTAQLARDRAAARRAAKQAEKENST